MKHFLLLLLFSLCILVEICAQCPQPKIISPNGSENLVSGEDHTVKYYYTDDWPWDEFKEHINFFYTTNNGESWQFVDSIAVDSVLAAADSLLTFKWQVPFELSDSCRVKILKYGALCGDISDNVFSITSINSTITLEKEELIIFPNPIKQGAELIITKIDKKFTNVTLYDLRGKIRLTNAINLNERLQMATENLNSGIYVLSFRGEGKILSKKIVIY